MDSTTMRASLTACPAPAYVTIGTGMLAPLPAAAGGVRPVWAGTAAVRPDARHADAIRSFPVPGPSPLHRPV
jgi:hypothetical protein